jgi:hypothetical protein
MLGHQTVVVDDMNSSPDELLNRLLATETDAGTEFDAALTAAQDVMEDNWNNDRSVVQRAACVRSSPPLLPTGAPSSFSFLMGRVMSVITPSTTFADALLVWGMADRLSIDVAGLLFLDRNPLAFHTVSFGPDGESMYLRRMAKIAEEVYGTVPRGPLSRPGGRIPCGYTAAIDTVRAFCET